MYKDQSKFRPIGVSLFSGAGGFDIGMERAGFSTMYATDFNKDCVETLRINQSNKLSNNPYGTLLSDAQIELQDICDLSGKRIKNRIRKKIDCVYGGPPCQSFSSCGKQGSINDPRGILIFEFLRFVNEARPRTFIMENVRGLITARCSGGRPGGVLLQLAQQFEDAGYGISIGVLNSADYGSYQRRVRCFIIGVESGTAPNFPPPSHSKDPSKGLFDLAAPLPWNSLGDFLSLHSDQEELNWTRPTPALNGQLRKLPCGTGLKSSGVIETTRPGGHWGYRQGTFIADKGLPARTVTGSSSQDWIRLPDSSLRRLTKKEAKLLQGFPSEWLFAGSKASQFQQIGNAVPCDLAMVVGHSVRQFLEQYSARKAPVSQPLPKGIQKSIEYTKKEELRNGNSRKNRVPAISA